MVQLLNDAFVHAGGDSTWSKSNVIPIKTESTNTLSDAPTRWPYLTLLIHAATLWHNATACQIKVHNNETQM